MSAPGGGLGRAGLVDLDLLRELQGRKLSAQLRSLYAIGCHRFEEKALIDSVFPALEQIALFEPLPEPLSVLTRMAAADARIRVVPCAVASQDGSAQFHVTSNDGESSSLLPLGKHRDIFPWVHEAGTVQVQTRRLATAMREHGLQPPDVLIVDVQGAEYQVLQAIDDAVLAGIRLIYTEVSTEPLYDGGRPLADVEALLAPRFTNLGYAPLQPDTPMHGNAIFVRHEDKAAAVGLSWPGRWRRWRQAMQRR